MVMSDQEIKDYLFDGLVEFNGYGLGWDRIGVEYVGVWYKMLNVRSIALVGDIDLVMLVIVEGLLLKGKTVLYIKIYEDLDLISCVCDICWVSMMGYEFYGGVFYGDGLFGCSLYIGITLLVEVYYLIGDEVYVCKVFQMFFIFVRKYTKLIKYFNFVVN